MQAEAIIPKENTTSHAECTALFLIKKPIIKGPTAKPVPVISGITELNLPL